MTDHQRVQTDNERLKTKLAQEIHYGELLVQQLHQLREAVGKNGQLAVCIAVVLLSS